MVYKKVKEYRQRSKKQSQWSKNKDEGQENKGKGQENKGKVKLFNKGQKKSKIFKNLRKQEY